MDIAALAGRTVERSIAEEHVIGEERVLLHLGLWLDDGRCLRLGCGSDGQSLQIDEEELAVVDMADYGRIEVKEPLNALAPGTRLATAEPLIDQDRIMFGLRLGTDLGQRIHVYNWGDHLYIAEELPPVVSAALA
jgi:hypothetical protein